MTSHLKQSSGLPSRLAFLVAACRRGEVELELGCLDGFGILSVHAMEEPVGLSTEHLYISSCGDRNSL